MGGRYFTLEQDTLPFIITPLTSLPSEPNGTMAFRTLRDLPKIISGKVANILVRHLLGRQRHHAVGLPQHSLLYKRVAMPPLSKVASPLFSVLPNR